MSTQANFSEQDIALKVGMFHMQNGTNEVKLNERNRSNVRAVVSYVDEARNYALGICPVRIMLPFSFSMLPVMTEEIQSGREATKFLLEEAAKCGIELPAAEFCVNYDRNGIRKGEAFLPSLYEMGQMQRGSMLEAWKQLGLDRGECAFVSSTIGYNYNVWLTSFNGHIVSGWYNQYRTFGVLPVIEISF
jgi:hypothetical protein